MNLPSASRGKNSHEVYAAAYQLYVTTNLGSEQVAKRIGIPTPVISKWALDGKWKEKKENFFKTMMQNVDEQLTAIVKTQRPKIIERHLELSEKLDARIMEHLDDEMVKRIKPLELKALAGAGKDSADIAARVVGLDKQEQFQRTTPNTLVVVNLKPEMVTEDTKVEVTVTEANDPF